MKPVAGTRAASIGTWGCAVGADARPHEDGTVLEIGPGEASVIEPGHDAEILGEEPFVGFEFQAPAAEEYAR